MTNQTNATLSNGRLVSTKVIDKINPKIEKGTMARVNGIIVHQTGGATADSALNNYNNGAEGAHFLIDKDGTIYQTARVTQQCWHVGKINSKCYQLKTCTPAEVKTIDALLHQKGLPYKTRLLNVHRHEMAKPYPDRYPSNEDSIGIEMVSIASPKTGYESVTIAQNDALRWLVSTLERLLPLPPSNVFRHPTVSQKQPTEASSARW
jgi:N-acetyl-anhydromuramyl-L-alanine amidase AmpD